MTSRCGFLAAARTVKARGETAVLAVVLLASGASASAAATQADPVTVVKKYCDAFNAGELDAVMGFFADDALEVSSEGRFQGKAAIREYFKTLVARGFRWEATNYREREGEVRYDYKVYLGSAIVESGSDGLTIVKNGQIVFDGYEEYKPK